MAQRTTQHESVTSGAASLAEVPAKFPRELHARLAPVLTRWGEAVQRFFAIALADAVADGLRELRPAATLFGLLNSYVLSNIPKYNR